MIKGRCDQLVTVCSRELNFTTIAMIKAQCGLLMTEDDLHDPLRRGPRGMTVAMTYARRGSDVPPEWRYDPATKIVIGLRDFELPWFHSDYPFRNSMTVAMVYASHGWGIPGEWKHDPLLTDVRGRTCAMMLAGCGRSTRGWEHDVTLRDDHGMTLAMHCANNGRRVPKRWEHDPTMSDWRGMTVAMHYANRGVGSDWYHAVEMTNHRGMTVAMMYAKRGVEVPREWEHDPMISDERGMTVAKYYANARARLKIIEM